MADTAPGVSYRLSSGTLDNMKEAAGNYMPNYGNWRFKVKPPEPEPEPDPGPEDPPKPVDPEEDPALTGSDFKEWGSKAEEPSPGEVDTSSEAYKNEAKMSNEDWAEFLANESEADKRKRHAREQGRGLRAAGTPGKGDDRGGVNRTYDIVNGEKVNIVETPYGDQSGYTPFEKQSPVKMLGGVGGSAFKSSSEVVEKQIDPREELMFAASNFRGATPGHHDQIKKIVGEMKSNFNNGDKQGKAEQHVELNKLAQSVTEDVGSEGLSNTVKEIIDGQLLSDSTRAEEMELISRFLDRKGVQPSQTEDKQWLNLIPTRNGSMVPMSTSDMSELIAKRTIQYPIGKEFNTALGDFESHGRQGGVYHPEDIKMQNMNLIKGNPDALASCLLDKGIFGTRPLIEKIQEVYFPDVDIDPKELVYQASQSKETYDEMVDMFAGGLERIAFERYSAGKSKFDEENKSNPTELSAAELIEKYA